jgi:hypothetical protein
MPTLPLLLATFFTSRRSSRRPVVSLVAFGFSMSALDDSSKVPSDPNRPRRFWTTKMPASRAKSDDPSATPSAVDGAAASAKRIGSGPVASPAP